MELLFLWLHQLLEVCTFSSHGFKFYHWFCVPFLGRTCVKARSASAIAFFFKLILERLICSNVVVFHCVEIQEKGT